MTFRGFALTFAAALLLGMAGQAAAKDKLITVKGCAHFAPPACTLIGSGANTYSLSGGSPPVPTGVGVTVVGIKAGDVSICFATPLKVVKWSRNRMRCPQ